MIPPIHLIGKRNSASGRRAPGSNVARLLRGSWRSEVQSPGPETEDYLTEAELTEITPQLCQSGSGALAWRRISNTPLANTAAGRELHDVYRRFRLSALRHEREIANVFSLLRAAGIEAVLVKGWAIARRYPDRALRPYGDIDLCVAPAQFAAASEILKRVQSLAGPFVDLHSGFNGIGKVQSPTSKVQRPSGSPTVRKGSNDGIGKLQSPSGSPTVRKGSNDGIGKLQRPTSNVQSLLRTRRHWTLDIGLWTNKDEWDEVFARTLVVECAGEPVRILSDEDHLCVLCLHLLRSGARRPAWLCDVALLVEEVQRPSGSPTVRKGSNDGIGNVQSPSGSPTVRKGSNDGIGKVQSPSGSPTVRKGSRTVDSGLSTLNYAGALPDGRASAWTAFDWDLCLGRDRVHANWVGCAIRLAHELLGASLPEEVQSPKSNVQSPLPGWLVTAVLQQWGRNAVQSLKLVQRPTSKVQSPVGARRLWTLDIGHWTNHWTLDIGHWTALYSRWDNPIRATAAVGGKFNNWPRLPYRLLESIMRLGELPGQIRGAGSGEAGKRGTGKRQQSEDSGQDRGQRLFASRVF